MASPARVRSPAVCISMNVLLKGTGVLKRPDPAHEEDADEFDVDDLFDEEFNFYVEKSTSLIYEAKFFDKFIIVRPASPAFYTAIRKLTYPEFTNEFDEFWGDRTQIRNYLNGVASGLLVDL